MNNPGKSVIFTKYNNLQMGSSLTETDIIVPKAITSNEVTITLKEYGNAVQLTEFAIQRGIHDLMRDTSKQLAIDCAKVMDTELRNTALGTTNIVFGGQGTNTPPANAGSLAANDGLDTATVKDIVENLATNNAPRFDNEYYVTIAHPHQLRQLRDDPNWIEAHKYMGRRQLYLGEVGMYEGMVFIETTQMPVLTGTQYNTKYGVNLALNNVWEAVSFGENAFGLAMALEPEMRDDGVIDMGRKHTLGWYGIWGQGIIEEDNIFRVVTA